MSSQSMQKKTKINFWIVAATVIPLMAMTLVASMFEAYQGIPYQTDKITDVLNSATLTNNPEGKVVFMQQALGMMSNMHGNDGWMFPTVTTDIDNTKAILIESIAEAQNNLNTDQSHQYLMLPHNQLNDYLNTQIDGTEKRLNEYSEAAMTNPSMSAILPMMFLTLATVPLLFMSDHLVNKNRVSKRYSY